MCDFQAIIHIGFDSSAYPSYFKALLNGGEHTDTVVDFDSAEGVTGLFFSTAIVLKNNVLTLAQNQTYTFKIQGKNSTSAPTQNCSINTSNDFKTSADPNVRSLITLRTY